MTQATTKLMVGMAAPTFQTFELFDKQVNVQNYRGRWLLLSFYRFSACALCNLRVHQLIEQYPDLHQKGLDMLAVFESPKANMLQYVGKQDAPFSLIADPEAHLYDLYGIETSEEKVKATMADASTMDRVKAAAAAGFALTKEEGSNFNRMPADFLIDPDGVIREAFYSELVGEHLKLAVIDAHLKAPTPAV